MSKIRALGSGRQDLLMSSVGVRSGKGSLESFIRLLNPMKTPSVTSGLSLFSYSDHSETEWKRPGTPGIFRMARDVCAVRSPLLHDLAASHHYSTPRGYSLVVMPHLRTG